MQLQKSAGSILASNKLVRSAPKRVAVGVNGGLGGAASDTQVSGSVSIERVAGGSACAVDIAVRDRAQTQDDARTSFSGRRTRPKRCGGRGTGAIKATGSYEGSLSVEGTSGRHEPSTFTSRWSRRPWRLPHAGRAAHDSSQELDATAGRQGEGAARFRGRGRGDRGVRGKVGSRRRGNKTPTLLVSPTGHGERGLEAKQAARV